MYLAMGYQQHQRYPYNTNNNSSHHHNYNNHKNQPTRKLIDVNPYSDADEFPDETSLFIGDLSRTVDEITLRNHFASCGEIDTVDIKRDKVTKNNLGYGFVKFRVCKKNYYIFIPIFIFLFFS